MKDKAKLFGRTEFMTPVIFEGEIKKYWQDSTSENK